MSDPSANQPGESGILVLLTDDEHETVHDEKEIRVLLARGLIDPETYYWKEGMTEWRPLSELPPLPTSTEPAFVPPKRSATPEFPSPLATIQHPPGPAIVSSAQPPSRVFSKSAARPKQGPVRLYRFRTNPVPLTVFLVILLVIHLGAILYFVSECLGGSDLTPYDITSLKSYFYGLFIFHLVINIFYYLWVYFTYRNCQQFTPYMRYSPGWAVGYYFVPFLNLFRPYQVMQEIWRVSEYPHTWTAERHSIFVGYWFAALLIPYAVARWIYPSLSSSITTPTDTGMELLAYLAHIELYVMLLQINTLILVSVVTWRQAQLVRRSGRDEV